MTITGNEDRREAKLLYSDERFTENTSLTAAIGARHDVIDSQHRRIFSSTTVFVDAPLPFSGVSRDIYSLLLDGRTRFANDKVELKYGFRYDDYSDFGGHFTPRLGLIYQPDHINTFKALYGNAFRAATAVEVGGSPFIAGNPDIAPEVIDTYELVYQHQTKKSRLEVVLFKSKFKNAISTIDTNGDGVDDVFANVDVSKSRGVEISYLRELDRWRFNASGSYVKSENKTQNLSFSAFPRYIVNLGVGYRFPHDWELFVHNRFHFDATEAPRRTGTNPDKLKDYWRTDVHLNKKVSNQTTAYANIRNLFDRKNFLPSLVEQENGIPDEGISLDAGIQYQF